jgi:uncharacterized protein (DUF486 family)
MPVVAKTLLLLTLSNVFMTFAWYGHLKHLDGRPWILAAAISWGIALFEYLLQVPANRIGYTALTLPQLKILQEVIALGVFVPFLIFYMRQSLRLDYLWASLCVLAAVYFIFRGGFGEPVADTRQHDAASSVEPTELRTASER